MLYVNTSNQYSNVVLSSLAVKGRKWLLTPLKRREAPPSSPPSVNNSNNSNNSKATKQTTNNLYAKQQH
jgi:hypothetical protein